MLIDTYERPPIDLYQAEIEQLKTICNQQRDEMVRLREDLNREIGALKAKLASAEAAYQGLCSRWGCA